MPYIKVTCSVELDKATKTEVAMAVTKATSEGFGKPTSAVMVSVDTSECLMFAESMDPCAVVNVQGIGGELSQVLKLLSAAVHEHTKIPENRIFVNMVSFEATFWGRGQLTIAEHRAAAAPTRIALAYALALLEDFPTHSPAGIGMPSPAGWMIRPSTAEEKKKPCWNCSAAVGSAELFCDKCEHLLAPDEEASHFEVLGLEESFDVDIKKLERDFWSLQKKLHPDRFGYRHETEQDFSAEHSSRVNDAYKVMKSPIDRAIYMLEKRGVTALSEGGSSDVDPAVLMNVMETREELADAETSEELSRLETVARNDEDRLIAQISDAFARDDLETATRAAIELRYATKLREEVEAKRVSQM
ncbi:Macrophage migration inhibitory factor-like [Hondaea fermentalgiana]|uniref:Macrophage migration inhibitory factor-like n=1 Tax=Hondaea fermentalgiana TaxID=2315210 RepID=A0A2R5G3M0_9STRA|nr:Macrophage migration inhibitory factor-like [Hondaea fermentalgiana]|eukprot:GBG25637.1 Macrophage migration inhibitory factor-like [Hondaea fermentalgiana]